MQQISVLYIEDDVIDQKAFTRHAERELPGCSYQVAPSISAAKKIIAQRDFDVIVTDYRLDDGTGLQIVDDIKKTPVIFITGQGDQHIAVSAMKKGAFDYIVKGSSGDYLDLLFNAIEKAASFSQAQKNLDAAQKEIRKLLVALSQIRNAIAILDRDGKIEWVNEGFENLYGFKFGEVQDKPIDEIRHTNGTRSLHVIEKLKEIAGSGKSVSDDSEIFDRNGKHHWTQTIITPVIEKQGNVEQFILVDTIITEKKQVEQDLKNKIEELNGLIYRITHDIRGPITSTKGIINIARAETTDPTSHRFLHMIESSVSKLDQSILSLSQMLSVNAVEIKKTKIDFRKIIASVVSSVKHQPEAEKVKFETDVEQVKNFFSDEGLLHSIIYNLVQNAVNYRNKSSDSFVNIFVEERNGNIVLRVVDNGIGIPPSLQSKIFEMFFRGTTDSKGSGLGLYIVKSIVNRLNGKISLQSFTGKGTTFEISLPSMRSV